MINRNDVIKYGEKGFDGEKYIQMQTEKIKQRAKKFEGKVYIEIGGKFLRDSHAARVLPGFDPESKIKVIKNLLSESGLVLYCISYRDIAKNRAMSNKNINYTDYALEKIEKLKNKLELNNENLAIVINFVPHKDENPELINSKAEKFINLLSQKYKIFRRYLITGYPNPEVVLSKNGYLRDDYIQTDKKFVIVAGVASNSGKLSTALGQVFLDKEKENLDSGYMKYETFPVWNLDLNHPVNLAYEAATADIGDYNVIDPFHLKAYGIKAVNYNRDVQAFPIIKGLIDKIISNKNYMRNYKSPTDMGINMVGFNITNDKLVQKAALEEIKRRKERYLQIVEQGKGDISRVRKCEILEKKALDFIKGKNNE